eukprot:5927235-Pleurochrysis_carterae.AAC.1
MSLAPTAHWSSSERASGDGAVITCLAGVPSRHSGGAAGGGGDAEVSARLVRLRIGAREDDAWEGGA